jgi:hypothetical protein
MGLAVGAGFYECVIMCFVLIVLIMGILPAIERKFLTRTRYMNINVEMDSVDYIGKVISALKEQKIRILDIETDKDSDIRLSQIGAVINVFLPKKQSHESVITMLSMVDGVISIDEV